MDWLALHAVHAGSADEEWNSRCFKWSLCQSHMQAINLEHYAQDGYRAPVTCDSSHLGMVWTGTLQSSS